MSLILDGTNGVSDIDGTAATPAIRGTDTNTGIFFPAADVTAISTSGTERMRIDGSGNVGVGTTATGSYDSKFIVSGNAALTSTGNKLYLYYNSATNHANLSTSAGGDITFTNGTSSTAERMRIDSSGNLLVGTTSSINTGRFCIKNSGTQNIAAFQNGSDAGYGINFLNVAGTQVGAISWTSAVTTYATSSDYRLKENIAPMAGALSIVQQLKPVTYNWKADGSSGQGFIAHELQEVVPECVTGEKDAVDSEGKPQYQGIDTSFLVATLTAAIQELKAELDTVKAELATLKAQP